MIAVTLIIVTSNVAHPVRFDVKRLTIDDNKGCDVADFAGDGCGPHLWHTVRESTVAGETILAPPLDRSVSDKRSDVSKVSSEAGAGRGGTTHIKPYSRNPCYWEYCGKPLLLIGGSDRYLAIDEVYLGKKRKYITIVLDRFHLVKWFICYIQMKMESDVRSRLAMQTDARQNAREHNLNVS